MLTLCRGRLGRLAILVPGLASLASCGPQAGVAVRSERDAQPLRPLGDSREMAGRGGLRRTALCEARTRFTHTPRLSTIRPAGAELSQGWATSLPTLISKGLHLGANPNPNPNPTPDPNPDPNPINPTLTLTLTLTLTRPSSWSQIWAFAQWNRTYAFAQELQERFKVKHTLLGPPHITTLPEEQAARLNANMTYSPAGFMRYKYDHGWKRVSYPPPYPAGKDVTVQAVRACPWPACIIVGCDVEKLSRFNFDKPDARLEGFLRHARKRRMGAKQNRTKVIQDFKRGIASVAASVKAHPCLKFDFQVYLRTDGSVFNVDLDRCFDHNRSVHKGYEEISLSNSVELTLQPGPASVPQTFCRKGSDQRKLDKALEQFYERLSR